jgi:hypothetical protein
MRRRKGPAEISAGGGRHRLEEEGRRRANELEWALATVGAGFRSQSGLLWSGAGFHDRGSRGGLSWSRADSRSREAKPEGFQWPQKRAFTVGGRISRSGQAFVVLRCLWIEGGKA